MAKRRQPRKLRDRRSGKSPYARYKKAPTRYSSAYYQWFAEMAGRRHPQDLVQHTPRHKKAA